MRKIIGIALLLMLAIGLFAGVGANADPGGTCTAPIDVQCTTAPPNPHFCDVYIAAGTPVDGCYNRPAP